MTLIERSAALGFTPAELFRCLLFADLPEPNGALECWMALPQTIRTRYPENFQSTQHWQTLGEALIKSDAEAVNTVDKMLGEAIADPSTATTSYLLGTVRGLGKHELYMELFKEQPFLINGSTLFYLWLEPAYENSTVQHPEFPSFAEDIGLVRAWERFGWPDRCERLSGTEPTAFTCQ